VKEEYLDDLVPPFSTDVCTNDSTTPLVPATYRTKEHEVLLVASNMRKFLESDLDVERLNKIQNWLWIVGLPSSPRPLHYQTMKKRDIVVTEQLDLHLVWSPGRIFIKPVPRYFFSVDFWQRNICPYPELYDIALGALMTYIGLIEREIDFTIAIDKGLLPKEILWPAWTTFAAEVMSALEHSNAGLDPTLTSHSLSKPKVRMNPRFIYGELRVGRLNAIYRFVLGQPRGYFSGCTTYAEFVRDNVNSFIALFAYTTIVLSAMQVGLGTPWLAENYAFNMSSYVFSVFTILAPLSAIGAIFAVLGVVFTLNLRRTLRIRAKKRKEGFVV
jgi:hypothetical protein